MSGNGCAIDCGGMEFISNRWVFTGRCNHYQKHVTDHYGRQWTWWKGNLYRHCGMAVPAHFITDGKMGLPTESVRSNPNYTLCDICKGD